MENRKMNDPGNSFDDSFKVRPALGLEEFQQCVEIQGAVWGYDESDMVPRKLFLLAIKIGGQVMGAFAADEKMVGFAMALPAYRDGQAYLHSHMLAVLPEYRNAGLGRRLKLAQRDDAIARGITRMEWTFDPLETKNAYLNIAKLGAISRRYEANFYGPSTSPLHGGLPTDRLYAEWWLTSPRVTQVLVDGAMPVEAVEWVTVPNSVAAWKASPEQRGRAAEVQTANQLALETAFARGLAVVGYERDAESNGVFLLGNVENLEL